MTVPQWTWNTSSGPYKSVRETELEQKVALLEGWVERLLALLEAQTIRGTAGDG
jgi:hypothetical protein